MILTSIHQSGLRFTFSIEEVKLPYRVRAFVEDELNKIGNPPVEFYLTEKVKFYEVEKPAPFAGASTIQNNGTRTVCVSAWAVAQDEKYIRWLTRHEMRHHKPLSHSSQEIFRYHDVTLYDVGFYEPVSLGFFFEDFEEIKCCDMLMSYFRNVEGIEDYL